MRILVLSTYPAENPIHGGQHRLNQIVTTLRTDGHSVDLCGVLGSDSYPRRAGYLRFPTHEVLSKYLSQPSLMEDWAIGKYAADPEGGFPKLSGICDNDYDLIFCEQPWLFEFAHKRFLRGKRRPALIYGSQNVEHVLKNEILKQFSSRFAERNSRLVEETERFAATHADLIIAVSGHDKIWLNSIANVPVVIASNGVMDRRATIDDVRASNHLTGNRKFALYCASGHPPNIRGFFDIFEKGLGCLAPEQRMVVAGAAGPLIASDPRFRSISALSSRYIATGEVSESQLRGLLATAHLLLLPITRGGGTNLKTAEALWSGQHVIGTTTAMRGFEDFMSARGVTVADKASLFQTAIRQSMGAPSLQISAQERQERAIVLWQSTLLPLSKALGQMAGVQ